MNFYHFKKRFKSFFRKKNNIDYSQPLFSIKKNILYWTCKICNHHQSSPTNKINEKLVVQCGECRKKHFISGSIYSIRKFLFLSKEEVIYVTNATARELKAKILNDSSIQIRKNFVYHLSYDCELAHKNYEFNGEIIAMNSGVIMHQFHNLLNLCDGCAGVEYDICPRCNGRGILRQYMHISHGICFRCWGKGYEKIIPVEVKPE